MDDSSLELSTEFMQTLAQRVAADGQAYYALAKLLKVIPAQSKRKEELTVSETFVTEQTALAELGYSGFVDGVLANPFGHEGRPKRF